GHPAVIAIDNPRDLIPLLRRSVRPGDSVVCLGAGVSTEWAHCLPDWLDTEEPRRAGGAL
ncbi:MAG: UDP-N-acetylmuramate--L-alanine ligase, partial [Hyphomicrobiaceae bacterium]|nr:UDP-N-acetylmuramate--L-alanine ligase [Hyphomicrobiaceae bacterium]